MTRIRLGDWVLAAPWTESRMYALKVLAVHGIARASSIFPTGMYPPTVWRECAVWLAARELAEITPSGLSSTVQLTDAGRTFVRVLDGEVRT